MKQSKELDVTVEGLVESVAALKNPGILKRKVINV